MIRYAPRSPFTLHAQNGGDSYKGKKVEGNSKLKMLVDQRGYYWSKGEEFMTCSLTEPVVRVPRKQQRKKKIAPRHEPNSCTETIPSETTSLPHAGRTTLRETQGLGLNLCIS